MSIFVDTSAFLAILNADDERHSEAEKIWKYLVTHGETMICSNYVLVETFSLVQHRLGMEAVKGFQEDIYPLLNLEWVDESDHRAGVGVVLAASRRRLSLVDCVSFEVMRRLRIHRVFCFDPHFREQGFEDVVIESADTEGSETTA